jgi:hypothetical protein
MNHHPLPGHVVLDPNLGFGLVLDIRPAWDTELIHIQFSNSRWCFTASKVSGVCLYTTFHTSPCDPDQKCVLGVSLDLTEASREH